MAKFYVNRGGGRVPEGPFDEQQIIKLIHAGKISGGHVSEVGSQRFFPITVYPPFAQALTEAGVPPDPNAMAHKVTFDTKKTSRGLLLGAVLSIFGLALAAVAIGAYVMFSNGGMPARGAVPSDAELFLEIGSVPQLLADLRTVRSVDADKLAGKQLLESTAADLSASFGVSKSRVDALMLAATSLGVFGRKLASVPEGGALLTFGSASPVNALLSSKRFTFTELVEKSGRTYKLAPEAPEPGASASAARQVFASLSLDSQAQVLIWFETRKVLFFGSRSCADSLARVLALDDPSIEQAAGFKEAQRSFDAKANAIGYLDGSKLSGVTDSWLKPFVSGYLTGLGPITANMKLAPAGLLARFAARTTNKQAQARAFATPALPLTVIDRLPAETFAYAATVTKTELSGAELEKAMREQIAALDSESEQQVSAAVALLEQRLHVHYGELLGSLGDQIALGLVAPQDYNIALGQPSEMLANFAVVCTQALKDEAPVRALLKAWQAELGPLAGQYDIQEDAGGYLVTPKSNALAISAKIRFDNGFLFVALGNSALVERSWRAFSAGENTLATEPAARAARAALPSSARFIAWVDVGRVVSIVQKNPLLASRASSLDFGVLRFTGPDRLTAAVAISGDRQGDAYEYRVDTLNVPIFAEILALAVH